MIRVKGPEDPHPGAGRTSPASAPFLAAALLASFIPVFPPYPWFSSFACSPRPSSCRGFYLLVISVGRPSRRAVALTFDDGPDPATTPPLLDLLAEKGRVTAAFFLAGARAEAHLTWRRASSRGLRDRQPFVPP